MFNKNDRQDLNLIKSAVLKEQNNNDGHIALLVLENQKKELEEENKRLTDIINQIINLTFENKDSDLETVVFQRRNKIPVIYRNGEKIDLDNAYKINIEFNKYMSGDVRSNLKFDIV